MARNMTTGKSRHGRALTIFLPFLVLTAGATSAAQATTYYVNSATGNDRAAGTTADQPWRSLARVRDYPLMPGDQVLLMAGSRWQEPLTITRSGRSGAPISVAAFGTGARPRIDAGGISPHGVGVINAEYVSVSGLEVTNDNPAPAQRFGVLVSAVDRGVTRGIRISDMYIHDVRGVNDRKDNGGIVFSATGKKLPTRFQDLVIERNIVWKVDRSGIAGIADRISAKDWFPSEKIVIRDNLVEDIGGDGIVPRGTDGALIEHNIVRYAGARAPGYNAGIWQWSTDNSLIQLNEAAYTRTRYDGQGFDSDFNSRRTTLLYNYSHDNAGGFLLICSPGRNDKDNLGNRGTVARYNVSRNDALRIFQLAGNVSDVLVEKNVIHVGKGMDVQMVVATNWDGWAQDVRIVENDFKVAGTARYGSESGRSGPDYLIKAGFAPAQYIRFRDNRYWGSHVLPQPAGRGGGRRDPALSRSARRLAGAGVRSGQGRGLSRIHGPAPRLDAGHAATRTGPGGSAAPAAPHLHLRSAPLTGGAGGMHRPCPAITRPLQGERDAPVHLAGAQFVQHGVHLVERPGRHVRLHLALDREGDRFGQVAPRADDRPAHGHALEYHVEDRRREIARRQADQADGRAPKSLGRRSPGQRRGATPPSPARHGRRRRSHSALPPRHCRPAHPAPGPRPATGPAPACSRQCPAR